MVKYLIMVIMVKPTDSFIVCKISQPDKKELNMPQCVEKQSSLVRVRPRCVFLGDLGIEENPLVALSNMKKLTNSTLNQSSFFSYETLSVISFQCVMLLYDHPQIKIHTFQFATTKSRIKQRHLVCKEVMFQNNCIFPSIIQLSIVSHYVKRDFDS